MKHRTLFVTALLCLAAPACYPQQPSKQPPQVSFTVEVLDGHGDVVPGLQRSYFTVEDANAPAPLTGFAALGDAPSAKQPQQALLVLDEVNTGFFGNAQARDQVETYLRHGPAVLPLPVTVVLITDTRILVSGTPTRDAKALEDEVKHASSTLRSITRSGGFYGSEERTGISLHALDVLLQSEASHPGRKLVVWLSPGWPYLAYPGTQFSKKARHSIFAEVLHVQQLLLASQTTLYAVDPLGVEDAAGFQTTYYKSALQPLLRWQDATTSNLGLQVLAIQSGGLTLNSSNSVAEEVGKCLQDAGAYYRLSIPVGGSEQPGQFHPLRVRIKRAGLTVRTIAGYYTP